MLLLKCFMCNTLLKQKDSCTNSICSSLLETVLMNVWKFPKHIFHKDNNICSRENTTSSQNPNVNKSYIILCKKCVSKLKQISKVYVQLQTLQKLLQELQSGIEQLLFRNELHNSVTTLNNDNPYLENEEKLRQSIYEGLSVLKQNIKQTEQSTQTVIEKRSLCHGESCADLNGNSDNDDSKSNGSNVEESVEITIPSSCSDPMDENVAEHLEIEKDKSHTDKEDDETKEEEEISERLPCSKCHLTFTDDISRSAHWRKQHEGHKYPFHCDKCAKQFKTKRQFKVHIMTHTGETPFICEHCGQGFRLEKLLTFHLMNKHIGGRQYKCEDVNCSREFTTLSKLKSHLATHSKQFEFPCAICNKVFSSTTSLNLHMVRHSDANPWRCLQCAKTLSCHSALKSHFQVHAQKYKFQCDQCPFGGPSRSALQRHMAAHTDEKGFRCEVCGNEFKYKKSLLKHLKSHAGLKSFHCKHCDKTFIDNYKLGRHEKIHDGNRPYPCEKGDSCNRRFYTRDALIAHMKSHEKTAKLPTAKAVKKGIKNKHTEQSPHSIMMMVNDHEDESLVLPSTASTSAEFHLPIIPSFVQSSTTDTDQTTLFHMPILPLQTQDLSICDGNVDNLNLNALQLPLSFQDAEMGSGGDHNTTQMLDMSVLGANSGGFSAGPIFQFQCLKP